MILFVNNIVYGFFKFNVVFVCVIGVDILILIFSCCGLGIIGFNYFRVCIKIFCGYNDSVVCCFICVDMDVCNLVVIIGDKFGDMCIEY